MLCQGRPLWDNAKKTFILVQHEYLKKIETVRHDKKPERVKKNIRTADKIVLCSNKFLPSLQINFLYLVDEGQKQSCLSNVVCVFFTFCSNGPGSCELDVV
jgi:hypothetical protein